MVLITKENLVGILEDRGIKICIGIKGKKCFRRRRDRGRLCSECHRDYMKEYRQKKAGTFKEKIPFQTVTTTEMSKVEKIDYEFSQEWRAPEVYVPAIKKPVLDKLW